MGEGPVRVLEEGVEIGDGGAKVGAQATDSGGLGEAVLTNHSEIPAQEGLLAFGLPDVAEILKDGFAPLAFFLGRQRLIGEVDGVIVIT